MVEIRKQYEVLFENMAQGAFFQDRSGALIDVNPAALEMFGLTRDQFLGRTSLHSDWRVFSEDESELLPEQHPSMVALATGKKVHNFVAGVYNPLRNGIVWMNINAIPMFRDGEEKPYQTFVTLHDFTERKGYEAKLRNSEERFRALFEQAGGYCMILDPNTADGIPIIIDANKAACEIHGYSREEFIGRPVADIDDDEGKRLVQERTREILTGEPFFVENVHVRKDGSTFHVAVNAKRIDIGNEPPLILSTEYDITERINKDLELTRHRDHLDVLVAEKTESLQRALQLMSGREIRMASLKMTIKKLRKQLIDAGLEPVADDPILEKE